VSRSRPKKNDEDDCIVPGGEAPLLLIGSMIRRVCGLEMERVLFFFVIRGAEKRGQRNKVRKKRETQATSRWNGGKERGSELQ